MNLSNPKLTNAEYQRRKKAIYDDFMEAWDRQRNIQLAAEERFNKCIFTIAAVLHHQMTIRSCIRSLFKA